MNLNITKASTVSATRDALLAANDEYESWSGGSQWLGDAGVESLLTTTIARRVFQRLEELDIDGYVTLETPFTDILNASGANRLTGRTPEVLRGAPRVDILVWAGERPVGVIEVKRGDNAEGVDRDCERVDVLLQRCGEDAGGSLRFGCVAAFMWRRDDPDGGKLKNGQAKLDASLKEWSDRYRLHLVGPTHSNAEVVGSEFAHWSKGGFVIELY